ncbi:MAG: inositol monophosphatase family protein [Chloroflexota bacterium]
MQRPTMDDLIEQAVQIARQTGELLQSYYHRPGLQTRAKPNDSVVTDADLAADELLTKSLKAQFPEDMVLSEELNPIYQEKGNAAVWVIDPLDGSTNFSPGLHHWGVSLARLVSGKPSLAVSFFPLLEEIYTAQQSSGAWMNGQPLRVNPHVPENTATFFSCCSRTHRDYAVNIPYKTRILGSAAYSLCTVARNSAIVAFDARAKVWDFAGSWLMVSEAGGVIQTLNDSNPFPLTPYQDYSQISFPVLAAATPKIATWAKERIIPYKQKANSSNK